MKYDRIMVTFSAVSIAFLLGGCHGNDAGSRRAAKPLSPTPAKRSSIEPRTPVETLPDSDTCIHRIDRPGSYYLSGNLMGQAGKNGIEIATGEVTLDLMGFSLIGAEGARDGILVWPGHRNVAIVNGSLRDWGLAGVYAFTASNSELRSLRAYHNGLEGLAIGIGSTITRCVAEDNGGDGIVTHIGCTVTGCAAWRNGDGPIGGDGIDVGDGSTVTGCSARENTDAGIFADLGCTVTACAVRDNGGDGILAGAQTTVSDCTSSFNDGDGIRGDEGVTVNGCTTSLNMGDGIEVSSFCHVYGNSCQINGLLAHEGAGIRVTGLDGRIEGNHVAMNGYGLVVQDVGNIIVRNSARDNGAGPLDDYIIMGGNAAGVIRTDAATAGPWDNFQ
jgi:hypothetical protein